MRLNEMGNMTNGFKKDAKNNPKEKLTNTFLRDLWRKKK